MAKSMLVAEDSMVMQKSIGITFAHSDYQLTYSRDGADALAKAKEGRPDIVIVDANIAGKNGYEVCQALKSDPATASTPVLLLYGAQTPFDEAKGRSCGVDGSMVKPFETQALINKVDELTAARGASISQVTQAKPKAPSPASTIALSEPYAPPAAPNREAPFLDMDMSQASLAEPDLGLSLQDDATGAFASVLTESTQPIPKEWMPQNAAREPAPAADDLWNFSEPSRESLMELDPSFSPAAESSATQNWVELDAGTPAAPLELGNPEKPAAVDMGDFLSAHADEAPASDISNIDFGFQAPERSQVEYTDTGTRIDEVPAKEPSFAVSFSSDLVDPTDATSAKPLGLSDAQIQAIVTKAFKEVIERIAWEVVPDMAEKIIREELARLTGKK